MEIFSTTRLEIAIKGTTLGAILLTTLGFLIVSLSDARYGFYSVGLFRPRMAGAGFLFGIFVALPVLAAQTAISIRTGPQFGPVSSFMEKLVWLPVGINLCLTALQNFFSVEMEADLLARYVHTVVPYVAYSVGPVVLSIADRHLEPSGKRRWLLATFLSLEYVALFSSITFLSPSPHLRVVVCWLYTISFIYILLKITPPEMLQSQWRMATNLVIPLVLLGAFARWVYPLLGSGWGGGEPLSVTITFAKDSTLGSTHEQALLVDETDAGYYVVPAADGIAQFIPRVQVAGVEYSKPKRRS